MKQSFVSALFLCSALSMCLLMSCINEDYDLEKIDYEDIGLLKGVSVPIGSTDRIMLKDVLDLESQEQNIIFVDEDGNYYISITAEDTEYSVEVPSFTFDGYNDEPKTTTIGEEFTIPDLSMLPEDIVTPAIEIEDLVYHLELDQEDIPEMITSISYADIDADLQLKLEYDATALPFSKVWVKDVRLTLPEWIILGDLPAGFTKEGNSLVLSEDMSVGNTGVSLAFSIDAIDFEKMPEGQGLVQPGKFNVESELRLEGKIYLKSEDCDNLSGGTFKPELKSQLNMASAQIQSIKASVDIHEEMSFNFNIDGIPEYFYEDNINLDFNALRLNFDVESMLPLGATLSAGIKAYQNESIVFDQNLNGIHIPASDGTMPVQSCYSISESGTGAPAGYEDIKLDGFNSILENIPDNIDFDIAADIDDEEGNFVPGAVHSLKFGYGFDAPLSFGDQLQIVVEQDITDLDVSVEEVSIAEVQLSFDMVNTLPLNFSLSAVAIDAEGNALPDIVIEMNDKINGGSLDSPAVTKTILSLTHEGTLAFDGIRLSLTAESAFDNAVLNQNQYLQVNNITLTLPEGLEYVPSEK